MSELKFDVRGNLPAGEILQMNIEDFKENFADRFSESNRKEILKRFDKYLEDLRLLLNHDFYVWIDGSFVSKKHLPKDIDFVSVLDYRDYEKNEKIIDDFFSSKNARTVYQVDAYVIAEYPKDHKKHIFTKSDLIYWRHLFSGTKADRANKKHAKGFVQINFTS